MNKQLNTNIQENKINLQLDDRLIFILEQALKNNSFFPFEDNYEIVLKIILSFPLKIIMKLY